MLKPHQVFGCNFTPSTAANPIEMWQAQSFDPGTIEREMAWAAALGFNMLRVYLHELVYRHEGKAYLDRFDRFAGMAEQRGLYLMPVFFDDCWNADFSYGPQSEPVPHLHNSRWTQCPGLDALERFPEDAALQGQLKDYVQAFLGRFVQDQRIVCWDLYNEPTGLMRQPGRTEEMAGERSLPLLRAVFKWAREVSPSQPLTVGLWDRDFHRKVLSESSKIQLEQSDWVSFHCYEKSETLSEEIDWLRTLTSRPLLCTEYMARRWSRFDNFLPVFREKKVGAINWGLVAGKTQTQYPWQSWRETFTSEPETWFHDILRPDGSPYDPKETALIQGHAALL